MEDLVPAVCWKLRQEDGASYLLVDWKVGGIRVIQEGGSSPSMWPGQGQVTKCQELF